MLHKDQKIKNRKEDIKWTIRKTMVTLIKALAGRDGNGQNLDQEDQKHRGLVKMYTLETHTHTLFLPFFCQLPKHSPMELTLLSVPILKVLFSNTVS